MENQKGLPKDWEVVKLGKFVEYQKGKKPKKQSVIKSAEYHLPYVDIEAFEHGIIKSWTDGEGCRLCSDTDFLMVWDGSRSGLVGKGLKGALGSTLMRLNFPSMENQYAYYFLLSKYQEINTRAKGSGTPHVDPDLLWNYDFPIPPYDAQKLIVTKIEELFSELDSGIASLKTAQEQLKIYRQALLKHAFEGKLTEQWRKDNADQLETPEQLLARIQTERETRYQQQLEEWQQAVKDWEAKGKEGKKPVKPRKYKPAVLSDEVIESLPSIPNSWRWVSFSELLFSIRGGTTIPPIDMPTSLPILRSSSIRAAQLNLKDIRYLPEDSKISSEDYLKPSDLLFSRLNGTLEFVGVCASMPSIFPKNLLYPDRLYCATLIYPEMAKLYECYFSSPLVRQSIEKKAKSTAGHKRISIPDISEQPVPIFDNNEAKKIIDLLSEKLSIIEQNEKEIEDALAKAELLRQSILKKAFNGQLVTSE